MAGDEVPVGDPYAVPPGDVRGRGVPVAVRGSDVGCRGEDDGVQAEPVHPLVQIDVPRLLETAQPLLEVRDARHADPAVATDVLGICRDVVIEAAVAVQCAVGRGEDQGSVDVGQ